MSVGGTGVSIALTVVLAACTGQTAEPSSTTATPEPSASTASSMPEPTSTPAPPLMVVTVDGLNLRERPGTDQPIQTVGPGSPTSGEPIRLSANQAVWVIDTAEVAGEAWYHVVVDFSFTPGWISSGPADDPWITPFDPATCPSSLTDDLAHQAMDRAPMRLLVCFGGDPETLDVYWPTPEETGASVPCPWPDLEPQWLICYELVNLTEDGTRSLTVYGTTELSAFQRGVWVTLIGHYDDPRSQDCPQATGTYSVTDAGANAATVLFCRTRFVAEALRP